MKTFRDLKVWEKAHQLALSSYQATRAFPKDEAYGLTRQIRSAALSIAANIAEGCGRTKGDFGRFLQIAMGSASELEYLFLLSHDLGLIAAGTHACLLEPVVEVKKMLAGLIARLRSETDH